MLQGCFPMFRLFFKNVASVFILDVAYISRICCKCFILILHMLAPTFQVFSDVLQVFQTYVASVSAVFRHVLQMFYLDVAKVDLVLHML
jgi:hypothetical protein